MNLLMNNDDIEYYVVGCLLCGRVSIMWSGVYYVVGCLLCGRVSIMWSGVYYGV